MISYITCTITDVIALMYKSFLYIYKQNKVAILVRH